MAANKVSRAELLRTIGALLAPLGYELSPQQPHIGGERELMSPHKLVLLGARKDGKRVVVKASAHPEGIVEITRDKRARDLLQTFSFSKDQLLQAEELFYGERGGYHFLITAFIEQDQIFVLRPIEDQFFIALRAFEAQESFHATTYGHSREVRSGFETYTPETYFSKLATFKDTVEKHVPDAGLKDSLERASAFLHANRTVLERYGNHLTHNDFVPHNMRVRGRSLYVLDQTSFWFGNKYEGWARFINYMELHNPELARLLVSHIEKNRPEEVLCLTLMRVYKLVMVLAYHASVLPKSSGNIKELTQARIQFWHAVLKAVLDDEPIDPVLVDGYTHTRDALRSEEEKARQREFAVA